MADPERYVTKFYDNLAKGKIMGQKCNACGQYQLLPAPCCRHCQSMRLEYVEFDKTATLMYVVRSDMPDAVYAKSGRFPMAYGAVLFKEGAMLFVQVKNVRPREVPELNGKCPLPVRLTIEKIAGNDVPVAILEE